jgi:CheY-like chemotaxis protein
MPAAHFFNPQWRQYNAVVHRYLLAVVTDILDFSKLEAGKMTIHAESLVLRDVLTEVRDTVSTLASNKQISIEWPNLPPEAEVYADSTKLAQILLNLLSNAIKFTPKNGAVRLITSFNTDTQMYEFVVEDTGMGIPEDKIGTLFESFRQVDGSHTRAHGGTGLGLAISKKLVDLHGGRIWVTSKPGVGSRFGFTIPIRPITTSAMVADNREYSGRVLVVDDDRSLLELVEKFLREAGYEVVCTSDPGALNAADFSKKYDAVIVDVMMAGTSGLTLLRTARRHDEMRRTPIIVSTAYHMNRELVESLGGIWLPKPWRHEDLVKCVQDSVKKNHPESKGGGVADGHQ